MQGSLCPYNLWIYLIPHIKKGGEELFSSIVNVLLIPVCLVKTISVLGSGVLGLLAGTALCPGGVLLLMA